MNTLDRQHINRCLAKAIAFKACGNREAEAADWGRALIEALELHDILKPYAKDN